MAEEQQANQPVFEINRIYSKDLSFESPQSPGVFKEQNQFKVDVNVDNSATKLEDSFHEVVLKVTVTAKSEKNEDVVYIAEAQQGGIFTLANFDEAQQKQILNTACANILFPYVREVLSDMINRGGFPPLYLAPINFDAIYAQQQQQEKESAEGGEEQTTH